MKRSVLALLWGPGLVVPAQAGAAAANKASYDPALA